MPVSLPKILISGTIFIAFLLVIISLPGAYAANSSHIVISEIQIAGNSSSEDFVELYNPTDSIVSLEGYRLVKRTSTGDSDDNIKVFTADDAITPKGYFLWCNTDISESLNCDSNSADTIANNNSVGLRNGSGDTGLLIDAVTLGTVANSLGEGNPLTTAPTNNQSYERKANPNSTSQSMGMGGDDEYMGNGEDTDNNSEDFALRNVSQPQNSASALEPSPTEGPSPTPSGEPSPTDIPTTTPTGEPTSTPILEPSPTEGPSLTPTQEPSPTVTPLPTPIVIANYQIQCAVKVKTISVFSYVLTLSIPSCKLVKN